jgi:hypothetical protein
MEKLMLSGGRFAPSGGENAEARLSAMEAYLTRLSEELELLLAEVGRAIAALEAAGEEA